MQGITLFSIFSDTKGELELDDPYDALSPGPATTRPEESAKGPYFLMRGQLMSRSFSCIAAALGIGLGSAVLGAIQPDPDADKRCFECHGQSHIAELNPEERVSMVGTWVGPGPAPDRAPQLPITPGASEPETRPALYIPPDALLRSVHADVTCVECHEDADRLPHEFHLNLTTCATSCHESEANHYAQSKHVEVAQDNAIEAPTCASCHGGHDIPAIADRQSPQHRLNSIFLCAECHEKHENGTPNGYEPGIHMEAYFKSAHGKAVVESGLVAAPTCGKSVV